MDEIDESSSGKIPKYAVILRFWQTPQEVEVEDIVYCHNKVSNTYFYKIIDSSGRLWINIPESDVIIIKNLPDKADIDNFMDIKRQIKELESQPIVNNRNNVDVAIC